MANPTFIWLGSRRSHKFPLGTKGKLLDIATSRGLPVPNGGILLHEFYELLRSAGVVEEAGGQVLIPDPGWLHQILYEEARFPPLPGPVAVRPAFADASHPEAILAEPFPAVLGVDLRQPMPLAEALTAVWNAALLYEGHIRRDVLVMEMVAAQTAGTAVSEQENQEDWVTWTAATAVNEANVAGDGETLRLPKLSWGKRPSSHLPPFARRLQQLLRGTRRTFGAGDWEIAWADDGRICWLLQVRPLLAQ